MLNLHYITAAEHIVYRATSIMTDNTIPMTITIAHKVINYYYQKVEEKVRELGVKREMLNTRARSVQPSQLPRAVTISPAVSTSLPPDINLFNAIYMCCHSIYTDELQVVNRSLGKISSQCIF